ncbi:MAG TPA: MarR family transcriptional regulator [Clostridiales bacterium]|nr:MarR family transcriptional regulator [Clostridiales bacterium]
MIQRFERFFGSLMELNRSVQKIRETEMRRLGLRSSHALCLYYLGEHTEGLTQPALCTLCKEDKAAISRSLSDLSERGLVSSSYPEGKRAYRAVWRLTEEGTQTAARLNRRIRHAFRICGKTVSEEQEAAFYEAIDIILGNLSEYAERAERSLTEAPAAPCEKNTAV